jgi:phospholipid N-methyltransferase
MTGKRHSERSRNRDLGFDLGEVSTWEFFRHWLRDPLKIAAVSPSSRELASKMMAELPPRATRVIELGGGTGVFTRALLEHGIVPDRLLVLELNQTLHQHLTERFPGVRVVLGDARDAHAMAARVGFLDEGPADAVISGLGLLSMPKPTQRAILESAFAAMAPHGRFIQFTYGPVNPVAREVMAELGLSSRRAGFTLLNLPPATVYAISRPQSQRIEPVRARGG